MLERLLSFWKGKVLVLCLLGFVAVAWLATITLSSSDATAHIIENPLVPEFLHGHEVAITLVLLALLGAVFLKGFKEAIGIAVFLVATFLLLTLVVVAVGLYEIVTQPQNLVDWQSALFINYGSPLAMLGFSLLVFPQLALGLSGFETGVSMMPLVRGDDEDEPEQPAVRIRNTGKMLTAAALIMSFYLLTTTFVTAVLIPAEEFESGGEANGRAIAYVAHEYLGNVFGTIYDLSTITILWFAGASAMAGLLNIIPRYLPRYGMAPEWAKALRPLVLVFIAVAIAITVFFEADVDAQAGAYATGVLAMMTSGAAAVTHYRLAQGIESRGVCVRAGHRRVCYALVANEVQRPDGLVIASFFIIAIVLNSLVSRVWRSTELRTEKVEIDETAQRLIDEEVSKGEIHLVASRRQSGSEREYAEREERQRQDNHIPADQSILFLEVDVDDPSEFENVLDVKGVEIGNHRVLRAESSTVPNAIAALLLHLRDETGKMPHCYFGWTRGNPSCICFAISSSARGTPPRLPTRSERGRAGSRAASLHPRRRSIVYVQYVTNTVSWRTKSLSSRIPS
jgi:hypothetical protein